jgi:hypothetical protein
MKSELSDTDLRVINFLRTGRRSSSEISRECFPGKNTRPAVAHLARMKERNLVQPVAGRWELAPVVADPGPDLGFDLNAKTPRPPSFKK